MKITDADKLACLDREMGLRHRTYHNLVAIGVMTQAEADREIAVMESIRQDYRAIVGEKDFAA